MKRTLICFSAGYDSSALLLSQYWNEDAVIDTCYFTIPNNSKQQTFELKNRSKILKYIKKLTGNFKGTLGKDFVFNSYKTIGDIPFHIQQSYIWMQYLLLEVDLSKYDNIIFGYVKYDDFWHFKDQWLKVFKSNLELTTYPKSSYPIVEFPGEWQTKKDLSIWFDTKKYYTIENKPLIKKIERLVIYCENPSKKGKACKKCESCIRHQKEVN